jgi:hypothetical protein
LIENKLKLLLVARGYLDAQITKTFLLSNGIEAFLYEESIGTIFGFTNTSLGDVEIYVKFEEYKNATSLLNELNAK